MALLLVVRRGDGKSLRNFPLAGERESAESAFPLALAQKHVQAMPHLVFRSSNIALVVGSALL